jgi:hypothetical protein
MSRQRRPGELRFNRQGVNTATWHIGATRHIGSITRSPVGWNRRRRFHSTHVITTRTHVAESHNGGNRCAGSTLRCCRNVAVRSIAGSPTGWNRRRRFHRTLVMTTRTHVADSHSCGNRCAGSTLRCCRNVAVRFDYWKSRRVEPPKAIPPHPRNNDTYARRRIAQRWKPLRGCHPTVLSQRGSPVRLLEVPQGGTAEGDSTAPP